MSLRKTFTVTDVVVHAVILGLGALQFVSYLKVADFVNDATYFELARSIIDKGSYELFSFRQETMLPPGFPLILVLVLIIAGSKLSTLYHVIAISATLGLTASYELLRRVEGRVVAVAATLLFASSPVLFEFTTRVIFSDMPYFAVSMLVLLLVWMLSRGQSRASLARMAFLSLLVVILVLIRSTGIAMLMALGTWMGISWMRDPEGRRRVQKFFIPLVLGATTQFLWMTWASHRQFPEWPVPGYPGSYLSQLKLKAGNYPELGMATMRDIPFRVNDNLSARTSQFVSVMARVKPIEEKWCSPGIFGILFLIALGLASSLRKGGGQLHDWYFLFYESMYVFWPWEFEMRFLLPIIPLAGLYLWRGGKAVTDFSFRNPKLAGLWFFLGGGFLAANCAVWNFHVKSGQSLLATIFWSILAVTGAAMAGFRLPEWARARLAFAMRPIAALALFALIAEGCDMELNIARSNAQFDIATARYYPDIEAAQWIQAHEPTQAVVMARKEDLVYHYSHHPVVWFPPISNSEVLMQGIEHYHVGVVVVVDHHEEYFMPPQQVCFHQLLMAHGRDFHLVHHGPGDWVFEVDTTAEPPNAPASSRNTMVGPRNGMADVMRGPLTSSAARSPF